MIKLCAARMVSTTANMGFIWIFSARLDRIYLFGVY